eukprot:TRINITY_DN25635_c0_g1_i1.p1 TRINITY_DN25635_c0_g1~~TRINITY_DN25635_c0_g1_i1.p1  ORF type:complete len:134 (+),score=8.03 TRINITY_DN25635_c0_g1_i1:130-531(+)
MQLKFVLLLVTALSTQWGVSSGEEHSNFRERRHYYYVSGPDSLAAIWAYVIVGLFGLCLCCVPCVVFGIVGCVAICVAGNVEKNSRRVSRLYSTSDAQPDSQDYCRLQSYSYPQTVDESLHVKTVNENDSIDA